MPQQPTPTLSAFEAADILGIKPTSLTNYIRTLKLTPLSGGSITTWRFTQEDVERCKVLRDEDRKHQRLGKFRRYTARAKKVTE